MAKETPTRESIAIEDTWELESIFANDDIWEEKYAYCMQQTPKMEQFKGTFGQSGANLYTALQFRDQLSEIIERLFVYANMRFHEDTTKAKYQALADRSMSLMANFAAAGAFYTPEILSIPQETLEAFFAQEQKLSLYKHQIEEITRAKPHIRSAEVEEVLASMAELSQAPEKIFEMIDNADLRLPKITDADGSEAQLSLGSYVLFLQSSSSETRKAAFEGMHGTFKAQQNTIAANLATQVKKNIFLARTRKYETTLDMALDANNIPSGVYTNLIAAVNTHLPALHRYLALRKKILAVDELHMYDLYVPLVADSDKQVLFDEARETVAKALAPLGAEYVTQLSKGMHSRWIDVYENTGKRGGAYSWGAYGTHPFVLLNYQNRLDDMFTLAHEMGHSMHSFFTWREQPYPYANYTIFLAEIASTLNEALLTDYLLKTTTDTKTKAYVLNHYLEGLRGTLFRQTMFADFELQIHQHAEAGEALTPEVMCEIYKNLNNRYFGDGGVVVDDLIAWEWSRIPHFYSSFYVYQYATGISASSALARAIISEGQPAVDRYLNMLHSGSSGYSIDLLRAAGVDMTSPAPVEAAIAEFERGVTELEAALGQ